MGIGTEKQRQLNIGQLEPSSSSVEMPELMPSKEAEIKIITNHKDSPLLLSKQTQFEIEGDMKEISILNLFKGNAKLISAINTYLNDDSFLNDPQSLLAVLSLIQRILPVCDRNVKIIGLIKSQSDTMANGIVDLLGMIQTANSEKNSTDVSSEEDGNENT
jgi:hypothetical protein